MTNLNTLLKKAIDFTALSDDQLIVRVCRAYLNDCFGILATLDDITDTNGYLPSISRQGDSVGIVFGVNPQFYPLLENFRDSLDRVQKTTRDGEEYFVVEYSPDTTAISEAESKYVVGASLQPLEVVNNKSAKTAWNKAEGGDKSLAAIFLPGRVTSLTNEGSYKVEYVNNTARDIGVVAVTSDFCVFISKAFQEKAKITVGSLLEIKDGKAYTSTGEEIPAGGLGGDISRLPSEKGSIVKIVGHRWVGTEGKAAIMGEDATEYWSIPAVDDLVRAISPEPIPALILKVTGNVSKTVNGVDKVYPTFEVKKA